MILEDGRVVRWPSLVLNFINTMSLPRPGASSICMIAFGRAAPLNAREFVISADER
jgi:hypothetical protein